VKTPKPNNKATAPDATALDAMFASARRRSNLSFEQLLREPDAIETEVSRRICAKVRQQGRDSLTPSEQAVMVTTILMDEVHNGGFEQYFCNSSGATATDALPSLALLEAPAALVDIITAAIAVVSEPLGATSSDRQAQVKAISPAALARWRALEVQFHARRDTFLDAYIRAHPNRFTLR
jgi:Domain of unknown function (DUF4375)